MIEVAEVRTIRQLGKSFSVTFDIGGFGLSERAVGAFSAK